MNTTIKLYRKTRNTFDRVTNLYARNQAELNRLVKERKQAKKMLSDAYAQNNSVTIKYLKSTLDRMDLEIQDCLKSIREVKAMRKESMRLLSSVGNMERIRTQNKLKEMCNTILKHYIEHDTLGDFDYQKYIEENA